MSEATVSSVPAVLDDLAARLPLRLGLSDVKVFTSPQGDNTPDEAIVFIGVDGDQEFAALGRDKRNERYDINGGIWIQKPGADEETAVAARNRAYAILGELENELRAVPTLNGIVITIELKGHDLNQGATQKDRRVALDFRLHVFARI